MAASQGYTGKGTVLSIGVAGSPETFVPILQMKTFAFSGQTIKFDDLSNTNSPVVGLMTLEESLPASVSGGSFSSNGIFLPSDPGQTALATAFGTGAQQDFKLQLPKGPGQTTTGNLYTFSGFITSQPLPDVQYDKALTIKFEVKINTVITFTAGS